MNREHTAQHAKKVRIFVIIVAVVVIGGGLVMWSIRDKSQSGGLAGVWSFFSSNTAQKAASGETPESSVSVPDSGETQLYLDPGYRFSFEYPKDFTIQTTEEDTGGDTILVQKPGDKKGFQIFTSAFDENMPVITPERIHKDLPDMKVEEPQEIVLANDKHALMFLSEDATLGKTREVWVIDSGNLYQISTYVEFDAWLGGIMKTFTFGSETAQ